MKLLLRALTISSVLLLWTHLMTAQYTGVDNYIGGDPTSSSWTGDAISNPVSEFNLTGWKVDMTMGLNNSLTINIFADKYFDNLINNRSSLLGTSLGDLFISTGPLNWHPSGDTTTDYFGSTDGYTAWNYGIRLGTYSNTGGVDLNTQQSGDLYDLNPLEANSQIALSDAFTTGIYRIKQEVRINAGANWTAGDIETGAASWYIDPSANDFLSITLNNFDTLLGVNASDFTLGFHWAMTCANDTIEFQVTNFSTSVVPEPRTVAILSIVGLVGLLVIRRRIVR